MNHLRRYRYVGPAELHDELPAPDAIIVQSREALDRWLAGRIPAELDEPFTFVVTLDGRLGLAPRRSEHVALAAGREVLAAGEMTFLHNAGVRGVLEVTNQSTGYCPDPDCWPAVGEALDGLGLDHPGDFAVKIVFRRCLSCGERNIVRDADFTCALCDSALPAQWNFAPA
ncbi:hypothetical protein [Actinoplanes sp. L3-i22]|uniref:hypothetical protein n=1 Tax=Actinoplanes sp. L3-i22 TaxID=2836373 RepID=UPI001C74C134|nr:hypothetical protein [Actinoplanes sp. L3-i22]BCY08751.1 hypothetical protein L3i22_038390 [Actinoplanes sp. L3-i22]